MNLRNASLLIVCLLLAISAAILVRTLPNWLAALPTLACLVAALLIHRGNPKGYSFGLAGLFLIFLLAVAYVVGDAEEPTLDYPAAPRFAMLAAMSFGCIVLAWVLKRAQSQERPRGGF